MNVHTMLVPWDDILDVMRRAAPKPDKYGRDKGGSAPKLIGMLRDEAVVERVAEQLWAAQCARDTKIDAPRSQLKKVLDDYDAAIRTIVASLST